MGHLPKRVYFRMRSDTPSKFQLLLISYTTLPRPRNSNIVSNTYIEYTDELLLLLLLMLVDGVGAGAALHLVLAGCDMK